MGRHPLVMALIAAFSILSIVGCVEDSTDLKQKVADLEKRLQKQEKDLKEFSGKFAPQRDFSADVQRIEEQQDKLVQAVKTKVEPVNNKLEELRDWAQEAQKDKDAVSTKLKALEQSVGDLKKRLENESREYVKLQKEFPAVRKTTATAAKELEDLTKSVAEIRKDVLDNNTKLVNAVKKTLPKVKEAAVAEIKDRLTPLEEGLTSLRTSLEGDRKALSQMRLPGAGADATKEIKAMSQRIKDLEDVITAQKSYLLEVGSKVHEVELQFRRSQN
ncbi:MAG: hypothetical protein QG577_2238 [Thermodesulfobacteriota bacterium]|nr:hypothetical protein [Thermodesulfobacteriota bacterium]